VTALCYFACDGHSLCASEITSSAEGLLNAFFHFFHGNGSAADVRMTSDTKHMKLLLKNVIFHAKVCLSLLSLGH